MWDYICRVLDRNDPPVVLVGNTVSRILSVKSQRPKESSWRNNGAFPSWRSHSHRFQRATCLFYSHSAGLRQTRRNHSVFSSFFFPQLPSPFLTFQYCSMECLPPHTRESVLKKLLVKICLRGAFRLDPTCWRNRLLHRILVALRSCPLLRKAAIGDVSVIPFHFAVNLQLNDLLVALATLVLLTRARNPRSTRHDTSQ